VFAEIGASARLSAAIGGVVPVLVGRITRCAAAARVPEAALDAKSPFVNL
jgi:hypothetical protein